MAYTLRQSAAANPGAVSNSNLAFGSNVSAGSLLVAHVWNGSASATLTASDNLNGSYTSAVSLGSAGGILTGAILFFAGAAAGATTVTFGESGGGGQLRVLIEEWTGVSTSSPLDQTGSISVSASANSSISTGGATGQDNELIIANLSATASQGATAGSGYTLDANSNSGRPAVEWLGVDTAGVQTATFTNSSMTGVLLIATFKPSAVTGVPIAWVTA